MEIIMTTIKITQIKFNNQFFKSFTSNDKPKQIRWTNEPSHTFVSNKPKPTWTNDESQAVGYPQDKSSQDLLKSAISNICSYHNISDDKLELITKDVKVIPFKHKLEF